MFGLLSLYPSRILAIGVAVGLVEVVLATLIGARFYREPKTV